MRRNKDSISLRSFTTASERRTFLKSSTNVSFEAISNFSFDEKDVEGKSIENLIGATQIPLAVAGPVRIKNEKKDFFIPLATTEGALVASLSRGLKAIAESGGATVTVDVVGVTRGPVFKVSGIEHARQVESWIEKNFNTLKKTAAQTSGHLKLESFFSTSVGKNLFVRFQFDTESAMGMNMATFATEEIVNIIEKQTHAQCISLAGNFDIDKKPAWLNFILGRGKKVSAEVRIKKEVMEKVLKVKSEDFVELVARKIQIGSAVAGSLGFNAHYANIVAAIFLATGQDVAQVVEGSLGVTTAELEKNGDVYFSIYLPALMMGVVGGGTNLPTQREALQLMGIKRSSDMILYCKLLSVAILGGELSLLASQAEGTLVKAHRRLGRNQKI